MKLIFEVKEKEGHQLIKYIHWSAYSAMLQNGARLLQISHLKK